MDPITMAIVTALAQAGAGAAIGAATPKYGMTQPAQASMLPTPDTSEGFSRLIQGVKDKPAPRSITIQDLQRLGGL